MSTPHPLLASLQTPERGKVVSAQEAVRLIRDGDTVATSGFVGIGFAEDIALALEVLYLMTGARRVVVAMTYRFRAEPKIVKRRGLLATVTRRVVLVFTELTHIRPTQKGLILQESAHER
ncbi:hypothetical protein [Rhodoferax sediminis]|uniref:Acyl CoA:acetate/3-ketoacid CoA transferase n=1 Tax=Rhodoferax sediminis TaxID=2509614 RepID=A0A515DCQ6_9BURK|nr:hypothetical protein [Rhodoferax sediminis]QDL38169.1 hypothetical protein EUB48_13370 [Rhodoferax sediminis]